MNTPAAVTYPNAFPLWTAILRCAPAEMVAMFLELQDIVWPSLPANFLQQKMSFDPIPAATDPLVNFRKSQALHQKLIDCAYEMLENSDLYAIGYAQNPLHPSAMPEWIPSSSWSERAYNWDTAELPGNNGVQFRNVRAVISPAAAPFWAERQFEIIELSADGAMFPQVIVNLTPRPGMPAITKATSRSPGGPSCADEINAAYIEARNAGELDFTKSLRANVPEIEKRARKIIDPRPQANIRGLGYEAVRRAVGVQFNRDKIAFEASRSE